MTSSLRIHTEKFRAINSADIVVNGITLVAGENGCGKSTLSKLLYFVYKTTTDYEILVKKRLSLKLEQIINVLQIIYQEQKERQANNEFRKESIEIRRLLINPSSSLEEVMKQWLVLINKTEIIFNANNQLNENSIQGSSSRIHRYQNIINSILGDETTEDLSVSFQRIKNHVIQLFKDAIEKTEYRPTSLLIEELEEKFNTKQHPEVFDIFEFEDLIISLKNTNVSIPYGINNVIYIDTPMMLSSDYSSNQHWNDLNNLLRKKSNPNKGASISSIISDEIIGGDVVIDENDYLLDSELKFNRSDGTVFNLFDVATGVKSFSIIQLLLKSGEINDKTLLIIDEPESHLHPQWIIEYARVIVLLNKILGVKFFLASHNPDMVSAIRYISEKESILNVVNFYLAVKEKDSFMYNYSFLDKNIDPIFESFNIAIDRINQYGVI